MQSVPLNISIRRTLVGQNLGLWYNLITRILNVNLSIERDSSRWNLTTSGLFLVKSMYDTLIINGLVFYHKLIWKLSYRKIFLWYLLKGMVLTKIT
jgi:ABC-type microcin C transport system permease subunit YejB